MGARVLQGGTAVAARISWAAATESPAMVAAALINGVKAPKVCCRNPDT
jgi:hypothetical protein